MIVSSLIEVAEVLKTTLPRHPIVSNTELLPPISIDSRTISAGDCFIAILGASFDGHDFIDEAIAKGSRVVIHSKPIPTGSVASDCVFLKVQDTTWALQKLSAMVRKKWAGIVVAVTGSMGKTTTRRFASTLLRQRYRVCESPGNLNNQFGLPLSLLNLEKPDEIAVVELGMNHPGEIRPLSLISQPNIAVITNVAPVHLESFDSIKKIAEEKAEILKGLKKGGRFIFNGEDPRLCEIAGGFDGDAIAFGCSRSCQVSVSRESPSEVSSMKILIRTPSGQYSTIVPFSGKHYLQDLGAAVAISVALGLTNEEIQNGILQLAPVAQRGQLRLLSTGQGIEVTIVDESYNSNPEALNSVLEDFSGWSWNGRKLAVIGDMLELGSQAKSYHLETGKRLAELNLDAVVTVGKLTEEMRRGACDAGMSTGRLFHVRDYFQAAKLLCKILDNGDLLLVKASRSLGLDRMISYIESSFKRGEVSL